MVWQGSVKGSRDPSMTIRGQPCPFTASSSRCRDRWTARHILVNDLASIYGWHQDPDDRTPSGPWDPTDDDDDRLARRSRAAGAVLTKVAADLAKALDRA